MALQVGMGLTRLFVISVGTGYAGFILTKTGKLADVLTGIQDLMRKRGDEEAEGGESDLSSQVRRLGEELRRLANNHPLVIHGNSEQNPLSSLVVPAAALGGLAYGYMWWKGISVWDLMYVTKRSMATAVESMKKHLEHVSDSLAATKRHLAQRIDNLDGKLDEQVELSKLIRADVTEVHGELSHINCELAELHMLATGLDGKLISMAAMQELANSGVSYLCNVVNGKRVKMPEGLPVHLKAIGNSMPIGLMGLKELVALEFGDGNDKRLVSHGVSGDGGLEKEHEPLSPSPRLEA